MNKRIRAFLLAAMMVVSLLPVMSFAATEKTAATAAELADAINDGGTAVITLTANITEHVAATVPADANITIDGNGKTLSGGMRIGIDSSSQIDQGSLTVRNTTFTGSGLYVFLVSNVLIENNIFQNIDGKLALQVNYQKEVTDKVVVKNNTIDGVTGGEYAGMELRGVQTIEVTGNTIKNVDGTCILLTCNDNCPANSASVTVTGNTLENWGQSGRGRAFRASFNNQTGKTIKFENNDMVLTTPASEDPEYAKVSSNSGTGSAISVENNYWNGETNVSSLIDGFDAPTAVSESKINVAPAPVYGGPVMNWVKCNTAENGVVKSGPLAASAGATITLYPKAAAGYVLDTVEVLDAEGNALELDGLKFAIPAGGVTVNATFKPAQ